MNRYQSWGRYPRSPQQAVRPQFVDQLASHLHGAGRLAFGKGRSYGDSCLAASGTLIDMAGLDRIRDFNPDTGVVRCEPGITLRELAQRTLPAGWFLPVVPGTEFVTVGGAIANDVHGKNHHCAGSFGHHVLSLRLLRSDGSERLCSQQDEADWFAATVGGLGLTGLIVEATLQLRRVAGPWLAQEVKRFGGLADFFALSAESAASHEYTVAWIDCLATGKQRGRGQFLRANHAPAGERGSMPREGKLRLPITPPWSLVGPLSLRAFNWQHYWRSPGSWQRMVCHYRPYFFPLDAIAQWNRLYGPTGFQQFQCVLPPEHAEAGVAELLDQIARAGEGSFLAVLKQFGDRPAAGWLSFARPGATLALDFPNRGNATERLLARLDAVVAEARGALYPAKDAHMPPTLFRQAYPRWQDLEARRDPVLCSAFWQRVACNGL